MPTLAAKEIPNPPWAQCSKRTELWYKHRETDSCSATAEKATLHELPPTVFRGMKKRERRVTLPSVALLTPCYRKVTTGGRNLSRALFHKIHLSSPRHMCTSQSFLQTQCACGRWRSYRITSEPIRSIIFHFNAGHCIVTRKSHPELHAWHVRHLESTH